MCTNSASCIPAQAFSVLALSVLRLRTSHNASLLVGMARVAVVAGWLGVACGLPGELRGCR